jgi:hypothetical protein
VSALKRTAGELGELASNVIDAATGIPPWRLPSSVLGEFMRAAPYLRSEYALLMSSEVGRTGRYLADVLVPSLQRRPPAWVPAPLRSVFFHETTVIRRPDPAGGFDAFPAEEWFFINGILTNPGMAGWNADYLALMFRRPFTIIQNATDGPLADLLECAYEKAFGMNGEPVNVGFPVLHRALKDASKDRIVIIAHSQGTLISAVMVRLLRLIYTEREDHMSPADQAAELAALQRTGVTLDPDDLADVTADELARLEIYCFANCASEMRYVDPARQLPWLESLGNEHDLVARLGMLAPHLAAERIAIDGPMWIRHDAWGHLLNAHYLRAIELAQGGPGPGPATAGPAPYMQLAGAPAPAPRLYRYLNGGVAPPDAAP